MQIGDVLKEKEFKKTNIRSERAELLQNFLETLNRDRRDGGYKPYNPAFLSMKLSQSGLKTNSDIYSFYNQCQNARNFGAYFHWALNPKSCQVDTF